MKCPRHRVTVKNLGLGKSLRVVNHQANLQRRSERCSGELPPSRRWHASQCAVYPPSTGRSTPLIHRAPARSRFLCPGEVMIVVTPLLVLAAHAQDVELRYDPAPGLELERHTLFEVDLELASEPGSADWFHRRPTWPKRCCSFW